MDSWRVQNREIDPQILHHIPPMGFEGINFGKFWYSLWSGIDRDCCHRARHRQRRWSRKQPQRA